MSPLWSPGTEPGRRVELLAERLDSVVEPSVTAVGRSDLGRLFTRARYAQEALTLSVADPVGSFRLMVPDRADVALDRLAEVVRQLSRLRGRFPWAAVRLVSLDDPSAVATDRRDLAGVVTHHQLLEIHLSRNFVLAPGRGPTAELAAVVVHECWHLIEEVFETLSYRESIQLRMALGRLLGLATFEHAYAGPHATDAQKAAALGRLREAVGEYATTGPAEGTAELFTAWWGGVGHPLVAAFGGLVDRFMPADLASGRRSGSRWGGPFRRARRW